MKKLLLTSAIVLAAGAANAAVAPYASIKAGYTNSDINFYYDDDKFESEGLANFSGFTGAIAGGAAWDANSLITVRGELEYAYTNTSVNSWMDDLDEWKDVLTHNTIMLNAFADFGEKSWSVRPYVGLGAGFGFGNTFKIIRDGETWKKEDMGSGFAYAGMIGAAWHATDHLAIDLGFQYKVIDMGEAGAKVYSWGQDSSDVVSRTVTLGARYTF
ncbi:MAG: acyloxyacyl hydrolase [Alphaproteobacteria bacterium]|nr:acyloxyacyl hydrolase [Alphaproteobacteria bacterium]